MARILVIDDEDDVRRVIRTILESGGHDVETAGDGDEALRKFRQQPFDLVLCDSAMPKKPGEAIIKEIRQLSESVPIVSMSGRPPEESGSAATRHIEKPFRASALLAVVAEGLAAQDRR